MEENKRNRQYESLKKIRREARAWRSLQKEAYEQGNFDLLATMREHLSK